MTPITTDRLSRPAYDALPAETRAELEAAVPAGHIVKVEARHDYCDDFQHAIVTLRRGSRIVAAVAFQPDIATSIRRVLAVAGVAV